MPSKPTVRASQSLNFLVFTRYFGTATTDNAASCSVCLSKNKVNSVMVPDRSDCPGNLHQEYTGILAGISDMDCFDKDPVYQFSNGVNGANLIQPVFHSASYSPKFRGVTYGKKRIYSPCAICTISLKQPKAVFTRFGRTSCPSDILTLYTGFVAATSHKAVCVPKRVIQKTDFRDISPLLHLVWYAGQYVTRNKGIPYKEIVDLDSKQVTVLFFQDITPA